MAMSSIIRWRSGLIGTGSGRCEAGGKGRDLLGEGRADPDRKPAQQQHRRIRGGRHDQQGRDHRAELQ
jgi:hypothetical protein